MRMIHHPEQGQKVPIYLWARSIDEEALRQLQRIASQPYVVEHVAAMPDVHVAEGVAVGTVFASERTVVPGALGGDLGCGMCAIRFPFPVASLSRAELRALLHDLGRVIPVGDAVHRKRGVVLPAAVQEMALSTSALLRARERIGPRHLGTLGGGNHFLEIDRDAAGDLWIMAHSGSRGLGAAIHAHHQRAALGGSSGSAEAGALAGLDAEAGPGQAYLADLQVALSFARHNREALLQRAIEVVAQRTGTAPDAGSKVDVHHNFIACEQHFGRALLVHRKGAIAAPRGSAAIVPGSMGTASYIVRGLGARDSFASSSHGAGRVMSRRQARQAIRPSSLLHAMSGVVFDERRVASLVEEAPAAYRDIREVLEDEEDLIERKVRLQPLAVLKG